MGAYLYCHRILLLSSNLSLVLGFYAWTPFILNLGPQDWTMGASLYCHRPLLLSSDSSLVIGFYAWWAPFVLIPWSLGLDSG
jgi:hypothetical protein